MYVYDDFDRTLVDERVREFRDQVARRLSGELTEEEFKPLRLMNGVYLQLHAYMLRIAIPYGTLSSAQLRTLAHVARRYDRDYGHFTTRQNVQFNWIKLEELPDAMADLADAGLHGMQTSGNCVRNITTDQWAGVAPGEIEDPRLWAELERQVLAQQFRPQPRILDLARRDARPLVGGDIAHTIAAGLHAVQSGVRQIGHRVGQLFQLDPVELDVLARGEMAVVTVVAPRHVRQRAQLRGGERAIRNGDPQHIGVQLQINAVHEPQRLELFFRQFSREAARDLIAEFADTLVHKRAVEVVVNVHVLSSALARKCDGRAVATDPLTQITWSHALFRYLHRRDIGVDRPEPVGHRGRQQFGRRRRRGHDGRCGKLGGPGPIGRAIDDGAIAQPVRGDHNRAGDLELLLQRRGHAASRATDAAICAACQGVERATTSPMMRMAGPSPTSAARAARPSREPTAA